MVLKAIDHKKPSNTKREGLILLENSNWLAISLESAVECTKFYLRHGATYDK